MSHSIRSGFAAPLPRARWFTRAALAAAAVALCTGCPDTEGDYDKFLDRYSALNPTTTTGVGGACGHLPNPGEVDGDFLFALSASISPQKPVMFDTNLTTTAGANGLEYSLDLQPLAAADRSSPVGSVIHVGPLPIDADGSFNNALAELTVPGAANPIIVGSDIVAKITLHGQLCAGTDFICGSITGTVSKPLPLDLASGQGSHFTIERLTTPGQYPEPPKINCDGDLALPL